MFLKSVFPQQSRGGMLVKWAARTAAIALAAGLVSATPAMAAAPAQPTQVDNQYFDWFVNNHAGFVSSPFLRDSSAGAVNAFLSQQPAGAIRAVKVDRPISNATAK